MSRNTATYIHCDGPKCKVYFESAADSGMAPENWLQVSLEKDSKYVGERWEFHSEKCLAEWAKLRHAAKNGKPITRSSPPDDSGSTTEESILEVFGASDEPLSATEIASFLEVHRSVIDIRLRGMVQNGKVFVVQERRGPFAAKYRINS